MASPEYNYEMTGESADPGFLHEAARAELGQAAALAVPIYRAEDERSGTVIQEYVNEAGAIDLRVIIVPADGTSPAWRLTPAAIADGYGTHLRMISGGGRLSRRSAIDGHRSLALTTLSGEFGSVDIKAGETVRIQAARDVATVAFLGASRVPFQPEYEEWVDLGTGLDRPLLYADQVPGGTGDEMDDEPH